MSKLILVSTDSIGKIERFNIHIEPSEIVSITCQDFEEEKVALAQYVEPGDEVIVAGHYYNCEGVIMTQRTANIVCIHGVHNLLKERLFKNRTKPTIEIVEQLAKELDKLAAGE